MKNVSEVLLEVQNEIHELAKADKELADKAAKNVTGQGAQVIADSIVQLENLARINGRLEAYQLASLAVTKARNSHIARLEGYHVTPEKD